MAILFRNLLSDIQVYCGFEFADLAALDQYVPYYVALAYLF